MTTATELVYLRPEQVALNPENIRDATRDIKALAASIKEVGVLVPLIVAPIDWEENTNPAEYVVIDGNRRVNAAQTLGDESPNLPCIIALDLDGAREQVRVMAVTAMARDGLTDRETATTVQHMLSLGMTQAAIARSTGMPAKTVRTAKLAAAGVDITAGVGDDLDLTQLATIGEFAGEPETVERLLIAATGGAWSFEHAVSRIRREQKQQAALAAGNVEWVEQGYTILDEESPRPMRRPVNIDALAGLDGQLSHEEHVGCPGRAVRVWINYADQVGAIECCTRPAEFHTLLHPEDGGSLNPASPELIAQVNAAEEEAKERVKAERRMTIANNKAMVAATDVRLAFLARTIGNKRKGKTISEWALAQVVGKNEPYSRWIGSWRDGTQAIQDTPTMAMGVRLWAQVCSAYESVWAKDCWRAGGREAQYRAVYLNHLVDLGYGLSEVEEVVIAAAVMEMGVVTPGDLRDAMAAIGRGETSVVVALVPVGDPE